MATLHALRTLGVRISMDDFGTGYSSLSYLRVFPFDKIKIDQSFVRGLDANREAQAIIRSIVGLGKELGIVITAEGVETEAELSHLKAEGCDEGQGFLFSRARPNGEIAGLLNARRGDGGSDETGAVMVA
jgi:EAL domain-containing protein (putative c-di-GMP-specific phosphodiesterase class I)